MGRSFFIHGKSYNARETHFEYNKRRREAAKQFKKGDRVRVEGVGERIVDRIEDSDVMVKRFKGDLPRAVDPFKTSKL